MTVKRWLKSALVAAGVTLLLPGVVLSSAPGAPAAQKGAKVTVAKGRLVHWKSLKTVSLNAKSPRKPFKQISNFRDPNPIVARTFEADPAIDRAPKESAEGVDREGWTTPLISFDGLNLLEHGSGWPPDTNGDVGINHYVQSVNTAFAIFRKSTGARVGVSMFNDFFAECADPCQADNNGDPIVVFDQIKKRWIMLDFAWIGTTNGSYFSIAASVTSDPTGDWWVYCFKADDVLMNDYPKVGVWHDGIYVTANMFAFGGSYQSSKIWAIKTPDVYKGSLVAQSTTTLSLRSFSIMPASARGKTPPPASAPNYLYSIDANEFGGEHTDALHVWKYKVNWSNPAKTTFTGPDILPVAPYDLTSSRVPQLGTAWTLDSLYGRLMYSTVYRKNNAAGTLGGESVYLSHTAEYMGSRAVRWYEVRLNKGVSSVHQQGTFSPDANHRWMGSISADKYGNIAIGYSTSSTQMYPAIQYTGRRIGDKLGTMNQGERTVINGTGAQTRISRWGDYSMMSIDPVDDETFWYTQEYYLTSAVSPELPDWHTRVASFKINRSTPAPPSPATGIDVALDIPGQKFFQKGTRNFAVTTDAPYYGASAIWAPAELANSESCRLETVVTKKTSVTFWWKVSSEDGWDYLNFYIDGVLQDRISGEADWAQKVIALTPGTHTLSWVYAKDSADSAGADTAWVDKVEIR